MLSSPAYYTLCIYYTPYLLYYLHFTPHLYRTNNMFTPHLRSFMLWSLLYLSLLYSYSDLRLFQNSMPLLILNLYMFTLISDSLLLTSLLLLMFILVSYYPFHMLLTLYLMLTLLLLLSLLHSLDCFHYSLPNHSMRIHSLFLLSHLYLPAVRIYMLPHSLCSFIRYLLLLFILMYSILMLLDSLQTMHYNYYYSLL